MTKNKSENRPPQDQCSELLARPSLLKDRFTQASTQSRNQAWAITWDKSQTPAKIRASTTTDETKKKSQSARPTASRRWSTGKQERVRTCKWNQAADESRLKENPLPAIVLIREPSAGEWNIKTKPKSPAGYWDLLLATVTAREHLWWAATILTGKHSRTEQRGNQALRWKEN
jgi:hypothetical protein